MDMLGLFFHMYIYFVLLNSSYDTTYFFLQRVVGHIPFSRLLMCQLMTVACFVIIVPEEKKSTLQDMASQRGVACRAQGWKIHLCAAQLRQLVRVWLSDCITLWHRSVNDIPENQPINIRRLAQHDCWVLVWLLLHGGTILCFMTTGPFVNKNPHLRWLDEFGAWRVQSTVHPSRRPYS